jgi:hypothetical protein
MAIGLCFFMLSNYLNIKYRIGEFKKLSDYRILDQGLNLSDNRISDSENTSVCPPLLLYTKKIAGKICSVVYPDPETFNRIKIRRLLAGSGSEKIIPDPGSPDPK